MSKFRVRLWGQKWRLHMQTCPFFLAQEPIQPFIWKRYIRDILCIWTGTRSELESCLDRLNKAHRTLKFTWNERIKFLDLNLFKGGRFNTTNLLDISTYFKKTNTFQYLHFSSSHPRSVFKRLVKGEAIRFLRSNTDAHTYYSTLHKFREHLLLRNYPRDFVQASLPTVLRSTFEFIGTKKLVRPVYRHFARKSHDCHRDHRIIPLEHCEPDALPEREAYWIRTLQTIIPHGLNSAYGNPYYPYDRSLSLSLSSTGAVPSPT